jgi:hypothetical protein
MLSSYSRIVRIINEFKENVRQPSASSLYVSYDDAIRLTSKTLVNIYVRFLKELILAGYLLISSREAQCMREAYEKPA